MVLYVICEGELNPWSEDKAQSAVGKLLWISIQTQPDISFSVIDFPQCIKNATNEETTSVQLKYSRIFNRLM